VYSKLPLRSNGLPVAVLCASVFVVLPARGQIVPDGTLPVNSVVVPSGNTFTIEAGTATGSNLFHSFSEFSIPTGSAAIFNNGASIDSILARVTGGNISNIDGLMSANGNANLFLLNPNGIVFGPNARLDLGGAFFATSAESVLFADGVEFSAANPEMTPLLTISVPSGLQFGDAPGAIVNRSTVDRAEVIAPLDAIGLQVPGSTLALVGGDVQLEGGAVSTGGGRLELGSVGDNQVVGIQAADGGLGLNYDGVSAAGTVRLSDGAIANSSGDRSGPIQIRANALEVDRSQIVAFNFGDRNGGAIDIGAETVEFIGRNPVLTPEFINDFISQNDFSNLPTLPPGLLVVTAGAGESGSVAVDVRQLNLSATSFLITRSIMNGGRSGDILLNATEAIELRASSVLSNTSFEEIGDSGNITVNTRRLSLLDSGQIISENFSANGRSGNVIVNASESVSIVGVPLLVLDLGAATNDASNAILGTGTEGLEGGDTRITTGHLSIQQGGFVLATGVRGSQPGNITIEADTVEVTGTTPDEAASPSSILLGTFAPEETSLAGGDLTIVADELIVRDGGAISMDHFAFGTAGTLDITANSIELDNGSIQTGAISGEGANAILRAERLTLRNNSEIRGKAGSAFNVVFDFLRTGTPGDGGNLTIEADTIVALDNSDIVTTTLDDRGGRINIEADGIFGLQARETLTNDSDIVPESRVNLEDVETVTSPDIDPQEYLVNFDTTPLNRDLLAFNCTATDGSTNRWQEATQWGITSNGKVVLVTGDETETVGWERIECDS